MADEEKNLTPQAPEGLDPDIPYVKAARLAVKGEGVVTGLEADGALLPCAGVFILRQTVAPTDLLPALETEDGYIRVDRAMATSVAGVTVLPSMLLPISLSRSGMPVSSTASMSSGAILKIRFSVW